jgi:hypothetical protein
MVKGKGAMHLDGDFSREYPQHERFTLRQGEQWTVVERGPRYINSYEVTEFDEKGRTWLESLERKEPKETTP